MVEGRREEGGGKEKEGEKEGGRVKVSQARRTIVKKINISTI